MAAPWPGNVRQLRNVLERLAVRSSRDVITAADLPREVLSMIPERRRGHARDLPQRRTRNCSSGWCRTERRSGPSVYAPFMAHDLTRDDVRAIIKEGLLRTRGGYKTVAALFNVPADHRRLVSFLRKHACHLPEHDPLAVQTKARTLPHRAGPATRRGRRQKTRATASSRSSDRSPSTLGKEAVSVQISRWLWLKTAVSTRPAAFVGAQIARARAGIRGLPGGRCRP